MSTTRDSPVVAVGPRWRRNNGFGSHENTGSELCDGDFDKLELDGSVTL